MVLVFCLNWPFFWRLLLLRLNPPNASKDEYLKIAEAGFLHTAAYWPIKKLVVLFKTVIKLAVKVALQGAIFEHMRVPSLYVTNMQTVASISTEDI